MSPYLFLFLLSLLSFFVFFKAEDGIRDADVTGVSDVCSSDLGKASAVKYVYEKGIHHSKPLGTFDSNQFEGNAHGQNGSEANDSELMRAFKAAKGGMF